MTGTSTKTKDEIFGILRDLDRGHTDFQGLPVTKKLALLLKEEPSLLSQKEKIAFFSIIALRNCLVHRRGVVGPKDCEGKGALTVRWLALLLYNSFFVGAPLHQCEGRNL